MPSQPYVLVNRSVLCNCGIEAANHFLLESLAACHDSSTKLIMYFTMNAALVNYLEQLTNMTESLKILTYKSLPLTIFGLVMVAILHYRKSELYRGCMFSNTVKIMIFISDIQYYVPKNYVKLQETSICSKLQTH